MYPVSNAFLEAVQSNSRRYYWTGRIVTNTGDVVEFTQKDILKGSGYISSQCCGSTEIELGTVYAAEMGITLLTDIDRYTMEGATIELFYHLLLADGTYEGVPMGIFEVSEANRSVKCLEIKAYDYMLRFEKDFGGFETAGNAYQIIAFCCEACGVELAHTQEEIEGMANGSTLLSIYTENDIETYRDVLFYIGQVLGGFFVMNREGKLELRKYGSDPVMEITGKRRFRSSFSDFITRYTAISSTNLRTQKAEYYGLEADDGLTMNLGSNPFLQFGLEETRTQLCENILADISVINYVPFDSETIGNPALDLGDILRFSGGQADAEKITCITSCQCKLGGKQTLKCVGKNPRLSQAKSKNDKNIAGLLNQIEYGKIGFFSFTNAKDFEVSETEVKVISIDFVAGEITQAEFIGLVILEVSADAVTREAAASGTITIPVPDSSAESGTVEISVEANLPVSWQEDGRAVIRARYTLNDTEIELFYPTETYGSGKHTFPLYYPVSNVLPNLLNNFSVYFSVSGGTALIEAGGCIATISGQGMAAEAEAEWDGNIVIEDTFTKWRLTEAVGLKVFSDMVSVEQAVPEPVGIAETVQKFRMAGYPLVIE
ncbi:MAG: hypothetical protein IJ335_12570 [Lachnospiraceae bacterium]|nr:hypothetical protein [Lachnospiraceae bacterium]MBQ8233150.1 hypothetical protein [Lachnospiraceae bacterium]